MENTNTKWFAAGLTLLMIVMLFAVTMSIRTNRSGVLDEILTVSMPRPIKEFILGFSLDGRNVVREIEGSLGGQSVAGKKDPKAATKAAVDKGAKVKTAQQKAAERARAQLNEQRRRLFQARVVEQAERYRQSLIAAQAMKNTYREEEAAPVPAKKAVSPGGSANTKQEDTEEEQTKKTPAEWESLVLTQPTAQNVQAMIQALSKNEIDLETYLKITEALIKDNSQEKRKNGLMALTAYHNTQAFILASHLVAEMDATTQKTLNDYMYSYNNKNLAVFDQVLQGSDAVAATAASTMITQGIQNAKKDNTTQSTPSGNRRYGDTVAGASGQLTISYFKRLIPTLKIVQSKNLNNLSQWAQTLLSQLQAASTTA